MLAYKWGVKTIYYSLINKVGTKVSVGNAEVKVTDFGTSITDTVEMLDEDEDCLACKL